LIDLIVTNHYQIQQEWMKNLLLNQKDLKLKQLERIVKLMNQAVHFLEVIGYESIIPKLVHNLMHSVPPNLMQMYLFIKER